MGALREAEAEASLHRALPERAIDSFPNLVFLEGARGLLVVVNEAVARLFGATKEALNARERPPR